MKLINKLINNVYYLYRQTILLLFFISLLNEYFSKKPSIESNLKDINDNKLTNSYKYLGDIIVINIEMYNKFNIKLSIIIFNFRGYYVT